MEDPVREVPGVVKGLVQARNADEQLHYMQKYFAPDASFDHPLCAVASSPNSRDNGLLPIYQWLRMMFNSEIETHSVGFDKENNKLYLDVTQKLPPTLWPLSLYAPTVRLVVVLSLQRGQDGKFYVKRQEDFYEPQMMPGALAPGGIWAINTIKRVIGFNCSLLAGATHLAIGYWRPKGGNGTGSGGAGTIKSS